MSNIGKDFKRKIANRIIDKLDWKNAVDWLDMSPSTRVTNVEINELGNAEFAVRVKTWQDGTYNFTVKVTENW